MEEKKEVVYEEITYLSGPIFMARDWGVEWRREITPKLEALGIKVQDPIVMACKVLDVKSMESVQEKLRRLWRKNRKEWKRYMDKIEKQNEEAVLRSHFIITFWDWRISTYGTDNENYLAAKNEIPIYCISNTPEDTLPDTFRYHIIISGGKFFESLKELLGFLWVRKKIVSNTLGKYFIEAPGR